MVESVGTKGQDGPGAAWNAREIARRNQVEGGRPLSTVMKTAATACELAHSPAAATPAGRSVYRRTSAANRSD